MRLASVGFGAMFFYLLAAFLSCDRILMVASGLFLPDVSFL